MPCCQLSEVEQLPRALGVQGLSTAGARMRVVVRSQDSQHGYMGDLAYAVAEAAAFRPSFKKIKIRFALGKQTFYESDDAPRDLLAASYSAELGAPAELGSGRIGYDGSFKRSWAVPAGAPLRAAPRAPQSCASFRPPGLSQLDLSLKEEKVHVSVYLEDKSGSTAGVAMALKVDERTGTINVRKIKSATAKPAMVTFVNTHPEDLDFCLKLLAQHHTPRDSGDGDARATWRLAEPLRWDSVRQLVWPKRADKRLAPRITRVKHKVVFEGQHGGYTMRVTITGVKDAFGHHTQVGGTCVELQQLLKDTEAGATAVVVEAALGPAVKALVSVLDVLANG